MCNRVATLSMQEPLFSMISGAAGTGKTTHVRNIMEANPGYGIFSATTGIAAINLDTTTINAILGYFNLDSIQDAYASGRLTGKLTKLAKSYDRLFVDEISMMDGRVWDIIMMAVEEVNDYKTVKTPLGITVVGDWCQLPPINAPWVFDSNCWGKFAPNITRLTKFWRQTDQPFLEALQSARAGKGEEAAEKLSKIREISWRKTLDMHFDGTTIVGTNNEADRINRMAIYQLPAKRFFKVKSKPWGLQYKEWEHIPEVLELKVGSYIMILANDQDPMHRSLGILEYANGSCGHVVDADGTTFQIELSKDGKKTGKVVDIPAIEREYLSKEETITIGRGVNAVTHEGIWDEKKKRFIYGGIRYFPLRPAYASTVHKSQGLTLDKVQVDVRHHFMGEPAMMYVALSRCRTPRGLTIVGDRNTVAKRTRIHEEVRPWL